MSMNTEINIQHYQYHVENIHLTRKQRAIDAGEPCTWLGSKVPHEEEYVAPTKRHRFILHRTKRDFFESCLVLRFFQFHKTY